MMVYSFYVAGSGSTGFHRRFGRRFRKASVQSQVRFNSEKAGRFWSRARSGSTGFVAI